MLRDKSLVPLSRHHQHALALCVRIGRALRAGNPDLNTWQAEMQNIFEAEVSGHFQAEEQVLFQEAEQVPELAALVSELRKEHALLREYFGKAVKRELTEGDLPNFSAILTRHVRKEEGELFEGCQRVFTESKLEQLGTALEEALRMAGADGTHCTLPSPASNRAAHSPATSPPPRGE